MLMILITIFSVILYLVSPLFSFVSYDMKVYLFDWYNHAKLQGFSNFIRTTRSDYSPFYLYIIWMLTFVPIKKVFAIKSISIIFNFFTALTISKIISLKYGRESFLCSVAYVVILFSPTVFFNSAVWGECDSIMAFFTITAIYVLFKNEDRVSTVLSLVIYAIGISFKMQPMFILPFFLIVLNKRKISLFSLLVIPFVYFLSVIPALLTGRSMWNLTCLPMEWYHLGPFRGSYTRFGVPNIYEWLPPDWPALFIIGNMFCYLTVLIIIIKICNQSLFILSKEMMLKLVLFFGLLVPFLLPRMWDRYFFLADILSIIYAFYFPRYFYIPVLINTASFVTYLYWLGAIKYALFSQLALLNLIALLIIGKDIIDNLPKRCAN